MAVLWCVYAAVDWKGEEEEGDKALEGERPRVFSIKDEEDEELCLEVGRDDDLSVVVTTVGENDLYWNNTH